MQRHIPLRCLRLQLSVLIGLSSYDPFQVLFAVTSLASSLQISPEKIPINSSKKGAWKHPVLSLQQCHHPFSSRDLVRVHLWLFFDDQVFQRVLMLDSINRSRRRYARYVAEDSEFRYPHLVHQNLHLAPASAISCFWLKRVHLYAKKIAHILEFEMRTL